MSYRERQDQRDLGFGLHVVAEHPTARLMRLMSDGWFVHRKRPLTLGRAAGWGIVFELYRPLGSNVVDYISLVTL